MFDNHSMAKSFTSLPNQPMDKAQQPLKYYPDWTQPQGKTSKKGSKVHIHPYDLISYVHKRDGIDKAGELAVKLINQKYAKIFRQS